MSTVLIVVIVVVVLAAIALLLLLPRMRERARLRDRERELGQRREQVAEAHRDEASGRERQAAVAEQRARVAEQEAQRERAEARVQEEKAKLHEEGLADHELISPDEREEFSGTSAVEGDNAGVNRERDSVTSTAGGRSGSDVRSDERSPAQPARAGAGGYESGPTESRETTGVEGSREEPDQDLDR